MCTFCHFHRLFSHLLLAVLLLVTTVGFIKPATAAAGASDYEIQYWLMDSKTRGASYQPHALLYKHIIPYNDLIDLEGIAALGITEEKENRKTGIAGNYTQKLRLSNLLGIFIKISGAIEPKVHGYFHLGLARVDFDISTPSFVVGGPNGSQSGAGLAYGLGITFQLLKKGAFVLEFNQLPEVDAGNETIESSVIALGYQMPF